MDGSKLFMDCLCDCGNRSEPYYDNVIAGRTVSCGCRMLETANSSKGYSTNTITYNSWAGMNSRCNRPDIPTYRLYEGIKICDRWKGESGYRNFLDDMGERPSALHSLDRINNKEGYSPSNCRWATKREQQNNRNCTVTVTGFGETLPISIWADRLNLNYGTLYHFIIKRGGRLEDYHKIKRRPRRKKLKGNCSSPKTTLPYQPNCVG